MKKHDSICSRRAAAFTLVEMIGVMAIIAIMASVLAPNALHSLERAAVRAEIENLHNLGTEIGLYLRDNGNLPTASPSTNWTTQLATYSSLSAADILTNRRQMRRLYVSDAVNMRALLISSMRNGVALPSAANVTASFAGIWAAPNGTVPPGAGWGAWNAGTGGNIEYLVIERVSLAAIYKTDLQSYTIVLNHHGAGTVSYKVTPFIGGGGGPVNLPAGSGPTSLSLRSRDRLDLYNGAGGASLNFSYVVTGVKSFDFTTAWTAL